jgi:hypothetical protein
LIELLFGQGVERLRLVVIDGVVEVHEAQAGFSTDVAPSIHDGYAGQRRSVAIGA